MPKYQASLLLLALVTNGVFAGGEFYCCVDPGNGRRVCSDTLPNQCRGRAYQVFDSGGNLTKDVGPPLTAEQKAELALAAQRQKQLDDAAREQRLRDQALLETYATEEDIDLAQSKAEADVMLAIKDTQARINEAKAKRQKAQSEAEFYKKKAMPSELAKDLRTVENEIKIQQELLSVKQREFDAIKTKYDTDRKRYYEVTRRPIPRRSVTPR